MVHKDPEFLREVEYGNTFVKVLPQKIGPLIYFHSDNEQEYSKKIEADTKYPGIKMFVVAIILILGLIYLIHNDFIDFISLWTLVIAAIAFFFIILGIDKFLGFRGTDYFVGEKGYAIYTFKEHRKNIVKRKEVCFDDINHILVNNKKIYTNSSSSPSLLEDLLTSEEYKHTECKLTLFYIDGNKMKMVENFNYIFNEEKSTQKDDYEFITVIKEQLLAQIFEQASLNYENNNVVHFPIIINQRTCTLGISIYKNGDLHVNQQSISKDSVTEIEVMKSKLSSKEELVISYENQSGKTKKEKLELNMIANRDIMAHFLKLHYTIFDEDNSLYEYTF